MKGPCFRSFRSSQGLVGQGVLFVGHGRLRDGCRLGMGSAPRCLDSKPRTKGAVALQRPDTAVGKVGSGWQGLSASELGVAMEAAVPGSEMSERKGQGSGSAKGSKGSTASAKSKGSKGSKGKGPMPNESKTKRVKRVRK